MSRKRNRVRGPMMTMKSHDVAYRAKLVRRWDYQCIVCGYEFANLACVTKEHVVPHCMRTPHCGWGNNNIAPSHYRCNMLRHADSFVVAAREIEKRRRKMSHKAFIAWLNMPVPHRIVPHVATVPIHVPGCLELPEELPGL